MNDLKQTMTPRPILVRAVAHRAVKLLGIDLA